MTTENTKAIAEAQIRALIDEWATAIRAKDVNGVMSHYAADIVTFDLAPPLQYTGADALRKGLEAWFPTFRGPVGYEVRDLSITAGDDVAFCRSLNRLSGTRTDCARLALMGLLARGRRAMCLAASCSTGGTRVGDAHGCCWSPAGRGDLCPQAHGLVEPAFPV